MEAENKPLNRYPLTNQSELILLPPNTFYDGNELEFDDTLTGIIDKNKEHTEEIAKANMYKLMLSLDMDHDRNTFYYTAEEKRLIRRRLNFKKRKL